LQLIVIRHGVAGDPAEFAATGQDDSLRPLTKDGRRKMALNARGLCHVVHAIDVLAASPLVRAQQTATIVAKAYGGIEITTLAALVPDRPLKEVLVWLRRQRATAVVAVVGHEPQLGGLITWLLTGQSQGPIELRKGGACRIDFDGRPAAGSGHLSWVLKPALLRQLAA
jgi:phosphohistidine phosphatase